LAGIYSIHRVIPPPRQGLGVAWTRVEDHTP
jgi:hypothetical protein